VTVDGLFQISDTFSSVEDGDKYDKMKVVSVSDQGVEMDNEDSITLRKGSTVKIFGNVGFQVADADEIRFAPVVQRTGTYEVRGTVINPSKTSEFTWTPYNFEGFYYDIDDDVGTESLQAKISGGTKIEEKDLIYKTSPQPVKFQFENWGKYDVIGFMADKYFAGYNNETKFTDEASSINEGELRRVLIDSDDSQTIASGSALSLDEGYELRIKQVDLNGNKVYLSLAKNGEEVDSKVVTPSADPADKASNYMYKVNVGSTKDVPIVTAHVQSVFRSTESDLATVDAIFQISDSAESVEEGEVHGKMKVESLGDDGITMRNDGTISLGRDKTVEIMENLKIQIADNSNRLMAPIATKTGEGKTLTLSVPAGVLNQTASLSVKSGTETLSGVQVSVDGSNIGTTDVTGSISYTPKNTGTFDVVAKKSGYNDAKGSLVVRTASEAATYAAVESANETLANQLTLNAPSEVAKGENFLVTVVEGINQTPVQGADIFFDRESIGNTSDQGMLTYSANATGEHDLLAQKDGFKDATRKITVISSLKVLSLNVPEKANAGQDLKITAAIKNTGNEEDSRKFELKVNDSVVDSKNLTVKSGENATASFSYKPKDPGLYRFSLEDQTKTVNVEKAQNSNWLIALLIILLIACGAGFYLYRTGELDKLKKQLQGRM
jgi:S-layer protein (TIGR01567 family)